jgi:ribosomal protein L12E/L44/L45/RPP1/RPP2
MKQLFAAAFAALFALTSTAALAQAKPEDKKAEAKKADTKKAETTKKDEKKEKAKKGGC